MQTKYNLSYGRWNEENKLKVLTVFGLSEEEPHLPPPGVYDVSVRCSHDFFTQVSEEEKPSEPEKEKEGVEEIQPDKDDVDEETDLADRRPTLQRNYNADDSRPLTSGDSQRRGNNDQNARIANNGGPHTAGPGGLPKRFPRERGFLVRVSNPPGQQVCIQLFIFQTGR